MELHRFPDGESLVRLDADVTGRTVVLACSLARPDEKTLPLLFAADAARDLGATKVLLAAPYLAYLRQDRRFHAGEAVTSRSYAALLSTAFDGLVTADPHLHRYHALDEIYRIPTRVVHTAPLIARWVAAQVERPLLIGPDSESEQWVSEVAAGAGAPWIVLQKIRRGDRDVEVSLPDVSAWHDRQPVLVDDIVSSARTMIQAVASVRRFVGARRRCASACTRCSRRAPTKNCWPAGRLACSPATRCRTHRTRSASSNRWRAPWGN
jgi:ribose-phosphate pyrophosphokinase